VSSRRTHISRSITKTKLAKFIERSAVDERAVEIEKEEPLKRQILSFIECARRGLQPKVSGFEATAALELAVEITKRIESAAQ
jgi:hypothetical protein